MPYSATTWADSPSTATPISAANLNHMEDGIAAATVLAAPAPPTPGAAQLFSLPGVALTATQNQASPASTAIYQPFVVTPRQITLAQLQVRVGTASATAGALARLSVYNATSSWQPGSLVVDAGTVAVDSTGNKTITGLSNVLPQGLYFVRLHSDASASQPTYNGYRGVPLTGSWTLNGQFIFQPSVGLTFAAAETPGTAWTSNATSTAAIIYYVTAVWS